MQLTPQERLILWHLFEIRRMLEPNDAKYWEKVAAIVENGYESLYSTELAPHILKPLPEGQGQFVYDVLDLYLMLDDYMRSEPTDTKACNHPWAKFHGFDGNHETELMGFCRFLIHKLDHHPEQIPNSKATDQFNSHSPTADHYRRMLTEWRARGEPSPLTADDVHAILDSA